MLPDIAQLLAAPAWLLDVLDTSVRVTLLLVAAGVTALVMRRAPAQARHQLWALALGATLILPLAALVLPAWHLRVLPARETQRVRSAAVNEASVEIQSDSVRPSSIRLVTPTLSPTPARVEKPSLSLAALRRALPISLESWLLGLWLTGIAVVLGKVLFDWAQVAYLSRRSIVIRDERADLFEVQQARLGLDGVKLVELEHVELPMTWGVLEPVVALPTSSREWSESRLEAAMLHELAHVRRRDALTQLMAWLSCAIYWFHPLTWLAARQMRILREYACDDEVVGQGVRPSSYAEELIGIVQAIHHENSDSSVTLAMARRSPLGARLIALLDPHMPHSRLQRGPTRVMQASALVLLISVTVVRPAAAETPATLPRISQSESAHRKQEVTRASPAPTPTPAATPAPQSS